MMRVARYTPEHRAAWDSFVQRSKNGTFLFLRDYMEYHSDRFHDFSLMIWDASDRLTAILPAHIEPGCVTSHGGLTYGGFVCDTSMTMPNMMLVFDSVLTFLRSESVDTFLYKTIPHIYHRFPAEEDLYALFLCNGRLIRSGVIAAVDYRARLPFQERRTRGIKKALKAGVEAVGTEDFESFWALLTKLLRERYDTHPVHTLEEITKLHRLHPDNIKLFGAYQNGDLIAGVVVYESVRVARAQYIAANDRGREVSALDLLFDFLVNNIYKDKAYFDLGTSDEDEGRILNKSLIEYKEGFGARAIAHNHYILDLTHWEPGLLKRSTK